MVIQLGFLYDLSVSSISLTNLKRCAGYNHQIGFSTAKKPNYVGKILASAALTIDHMVPRSFAAVKATKLEARQASLSVECDTDLGWFEICRRDSINENLRFLTDPARLRIADIGNYTGYAAKRDLELFELRGDLFEFTEALRNGGLLQMGNFSGWRVTVNAELTLIDKLGFAAFAASSVVDQIER